MRPRTSATSPLAARLLVCALAACALATCALAACDRTKPPPPRPELIETIRDFADRTCACETDKECVRAIRDEFDAVKRDVLSHGLTGDQAAAFGAELERFRHCGDAAGLTIWLDGN